MSVQKIGSDVGVDTDILFRFDKLAAVKKNQFKSKTFATSRTFLLYLPVSAAC